MDKESLVSVGKQLLDYILLVRQKHEEIQQQLKVLELHAQIYLQGIDVEQVFSYRYEPSLDKRQPLYGGKIWAQEHHHYLRNYREQNPVYNVLVMKDGECIEIQPIPRP